MKITTDFDRETLKLVVEFQSNLLIKYYNNFVGLLREDMPDGYSVTNPTPNIAKILLPVSSIDKEKEAVGFNAGPIMGVINKFNASALKYELEHTEFIPLNGYPLVDLKEDIKTSVKNHRNLCVLKDYEEYLQMTSENRFAFTQVYVDYGSPEWGDIVLDILFDRMEDLKKRMESKLKLTEWS